MVVLNDLILPLLPAKARPYAKAWLNLIVTLLALASAVMVNPVLGAVVQMLGVAGVYAQPNARKMSTETKMV